MESKSPDTPVSRQKSHEKSKPGNKDRPWTAVLAVLLFLAAFFGGFEIIERVYLRDVSEMWLHKMHLFRGILASVATGGLVAYLLEVRFRSGSTARRFANDVNPWIHRLQEVSIRTKLIVPFILLSTLPAAVVGYYAIAHTGNTLKNEIVSQVQSEAVARANDMQEFLLQVETDARFLASLAPIRSLAGHRSEASRCKAEDALLVFSQGRRAFYQVRYLDSRGMEMVRLNLKDGRPLPVPAELLQDKSDRYYFREGMEANAGGVYASPMDLNMEFGRIESPPNPVVRYASPVLDERGEKAGLIVINLFAEHLFSVLRPFPNQTRIMILDRSGVVLASSPEQPTGATRILFQPGLTLSELGLSGASRRILADTAGILESNESFMIHAPIRRTADEAWAGWIFAAKTPFSAVIAPLHHQKALLYLALSAMIVLACLVGLLIGHYITRPIIRLARGMEEIAAGQFDLRLNIATGDEIEFLAQQANRMAEKLGESDRRLRNWNDELQKEVSRQTEEIRRSQEHLASAQHLAAMGQFAAGVAHEIGNPLGAMKLAAQAIDATAVAWPRPADPDRCKICEPVVAHPRIHTLAMRLVEEIDRLAGIVRNFNAFARPAPTRLAPCQLEDMIGPLVDLSKKTAEKAGIRIETDISPRLPEILVDFQQARQIILNLILNAIQAQPGGGRILVSAAPNGGNKVAVHVSDMGGGIRPEDREKIFQPFYTTRADGTGLGLSVARRLAAQNNAELYLGHANGWNTVFTLELRAMAGAAT
ncbi:MAG: hypothetical protein A3G34_12305 [Candidatus Lindowbacteria bacterium RIFCSPLOWO2_12_FULL_62_27]|nr:MAG: hypothetical protein A3I06_11955 [Candidatus Lindowbacteria bacterium RIFCSPLOWO2_02_FULL_62_12]OGH62381.1 MAG: hypothetical protein A3G34_12305 [Candidatus Lindowbacteria bacterium RIFCSPLOWO2_12_FULL_62_27]